MNNSQQLLLVPENFSSIQRAIDSATENDTILVNQGIYCENLIINKSQHGVEFKKKLYQFPPKIKDLLNIKSQDKVEVHVDQPVVNQYDSLLELVA